MLQDHFESFEILQESLSDDYMNLVEIAIKHAQDSEKVLAITFMN